MKEKFFITKLPSDLFLEESFEKISKVYAQIDNKELTKEAHLLITKTITNEPILLREKRTQLLLLIWLYKGEYYSLPTIQIISLKQPGKIELYASISNKRRALISNEKGNVDPKELLAYLNSVVDENEGIFLSVTFEFIKPEDIIGLEELSFVLEDTTKDNIQAKLDANELLVVRMEEDSNEVEVMQGILKMGESICIFPVLEVNNQILLAYLGNGKYGGFYMDLGTKSKLNPNISNELSLVIKAVDSFA